MTRDRELSASTYARAIERRWSELAVRPVVLSPRDWSRISDWHSRGIPLEIVHEAMEEAASRVRGTTPLRSLAVVARAVQEAWNVVREGRVATVPTSEPSPALRPKSPREVWMDLMDREGRESGLALLLQELLDRLERGEDASLLDEELDRRLPECVPENLLESVMRDLSRDLEGYRSRMSSEQFAASCRRGCVARLRRRLGLPRLSDS